MVMLCLNIDGLVSLDFGGNCSYYISMVILCLNMDGNLNIHDN